MSTASLLVAKAKKERRRSRGPETLEHEVSISVEMQQRLLQASSGTPEPTVAQKKKRATLTEEIMSPRVGTAEHRVTFNSKTVSGSTSAVGTVCCYLHKVTKAPIMAFERNTQDNGGALELPIPAIELARRLQDVVIEWYDTFSGAEYVIRLYTEEAAEEIWQFMRVYAPKEVSPANQQIDTAVQSQLKDLFSVKPIELRDPERIVQGVFTGPYEPVDNLAGVLSKRGSQGLKKWRQRSVKLNKRAGAMIVLNEKGSCGGKRAEPLETRTIFLKDIRTVEVVREKNKVTLSVQLPGPRTYLFGAKDEANYVLKWATAIATHCLLQSVRESMASQRIISFIDQGANINCTDDDATHTPILCFALRNDKQDVASVLLKRGANYQCLLRYSFFQKLCPGARILNTLIGNQADINVAGDDELQWTLLHHMVWAGDAPSVMTILSSTHALRHLDINKKDSCGQTALHLALNSPHNSDVIAHMLFEHKELDVNAADNYGNTPLHLVVKQGRTELALKMVEELRGDVNIVDGGGDSSLHLAIKLGNRKLAQTWVLTPGVDVNKRDKLLNDTPLILAIKMRDTELASLLIQKGADSTPGSHHVMPGYADTKGDPALHLAIKYGLKALAESMVWNGVDVNVLDGRGFHALHTAHTQGMVELTQHIAAVPGVHLNRQAPGSGDTVLHMAFRDLKVKLAMTLLERGADANVQNKLGDSPMHVYLRFVIEEDPCPYTAVDVLQGTTDPSSNSMNQDGVEDKKQWRALRAKVQGVYSSIATLLKYGAEPALQSFGNLETPLHIAITRQFYSAVDLLLTHDPALATIRDCKGETALTLAIMGGLENVVARVLVANSSVDFVNEAGDTPILLAYKQGLLNVVHWLAQRGAYTDFWDKNGLAVIHLATIANDVSTISVLAANKADINLRTRQGDTPILLAVMYNQLEAAQLLIDLGCNLRLCSTHGVNSVLHVASSKRDVLNPALLQLLYSKRQNILISFSKNEAGETIESVVKTLKACVPEYEVSQVVAHADTEEPAGFHRANSAFHRASSMQNLEVRAEQRQAMEQKMRHGAAVYIQAAYRGWQVRKALLKSRQDAARLAKVDELRERHAAVVVQKEYRKFKSQKKQETAAAIRIQSDFRGAQVRREMRKEREAATVIQTRYRGAQAKKHTASVNKEEEETQQAAAEVAGQLEYQEQGQEQHGDMEEVALEAVPAPVTTVSTDEEPVTVWAYDTEMDKATTYEQVAVSSPSTQPESVSESTPVSTATALPDGELICESVVGDSGVPVPSEPAIVELDAAAIKIQSVYRGRTTRKVYERVKSSLEIERQMEAEEEERLSRKSSRSSVLSASPMVTDTNGYDMDESTHPQLDDIAVVIPV